MFGLEHNQVVFAITKGEKQHMSLKRLSFTSLLLFLFAMTPGASASEIDLGGGFEAGGVSYGENVHNPTDPVIVEPAANVGYTQALYSYETGGDNWFWSNAIDWRGQHYHLKKNNELTKSYIYRNYGPFYANPFITLDREVDKIDVTSDPKSSYLYYKLPGDDLTIYRQRLVKSVNMTPESKTFSFEGTPFAFETFTLAQNADDFLLCSAIDENLMVTIGLFSFNGGTEPKRVWHCTLPQEWKDTFRPVTAGEKGYYMTFEAMTGKIWVYARKTFSNRSNQDWWFFCGDISGQGELSPYYPATEIPGWNSGNLKILSIGRYGRVVLEYIGALPGDKLSLRELDPVTRLYKEGAITVWSDNGNEKTLNNFYEDKLDLPTTSSYINWSGRDVDGQGNLYLTFNQHRWPTTNHPERYSQRFAIFSPTGTSAINAPEPDPSADGGARFRPTNVVLKSSRPALPDDATITGSAWEVYGDEAEPVYTDNNSDDSTTHTVAATLPDGGYTWRVAYDWERRGIGDTVRGSTSWSRDASIVVETEVASPPPPPPPPTNDDDDDDDVNSGGGGGGCDAGVGALALILTASMIFKNIRKKYK
jgi:hypothetical protein